MREPPVPQREPGRHLLHSQHGEHIQPSPVQRLRRLLIGLRPRQHVRAGPVLQLPLPSRVRPLLLQTPHSRPALLPQHQRPSLLGRLLPPRRRLPLLQEALGPTDHAICGNTTRYGPAFIASVGKAVAAAVSQAESNSGYGSGKVVDPSGTSSAYAMASCLRTLDAGGCQQCLSNASASARRCFPWSEGRVDNTGCFLRYSDTDFLSSGGGNGGSKGSRTVKIIAIACSVAIVGLGSAVGVLLWKRNSIIQKRRKGMSKASIKMASALSKSSLNFKYSTLVRATSTFDPANKLGEGGFGTVYKGVLADGREVAVKRLYINNRHRVMDFFNEVNIISSVEHKNLVDCWVVAWGLIACLFTNTSPT
ncbi:Cysteine-rich receptor-like protein kinase 2 [Acorus calamus]|uniref:Cysteine-rich receptor-like protein kinase 2 n=1 Tax=Acorus calamus TaxID=4465 RepID=A0AAV9DNX2_ACOCL|nr:Cysteine-rich receptor-like protein kinase 2 [Acorus calamus]